MTSFVTQFYDSAAFIPPEILLQNEVAEASVIEAWLRDRRGEKVTIQVPRRGEKKGLVDMVADNATQIMEQMRVKWMADEAKTTGALRELAEHLDLAEPPRRIECYDISNIHGTSAVGAMVVFENGQPRPSAYRRFQIKSVEGSNDFAMLQEVLARRFRRAGARTEADGADTNGLADTADSGKWKDMPDLIIIDGGRGQLNAALGTLQKLGLDRLDCVSLAKQQEEIFTAKSFESILLPRDSQSLYLVQRIRDETHRFAITYHRAVRAKRAVHSVLDDVPRIGPKRRVALLRQFGSVTAIRQAPEEALLAVPGMDRVAVRALKEHLSET
jgi:excinuclease ABC subunit C